MINTKKPIARLSATNIMEMTIIEALCILNTGWKTDEEKKLLDIAYAIVSKESLKLHLEYQKKMIEKKLQNFKEEL